MTAGTERSTMEEYANYIIVDAPVSRGEGDDPRKLIWFNVDDVLIDQNTQRKVLPGRIESMTPWQWPLVEIVTITVRADGTLVVTEGQNRVMRRRMDAPGTSMWGVLSPDSRESAVALGIARGRRPHTTMDKWRLRKHEGDPRVLAAEAVLENFDPPLWLYDQTGKSGYGIAAVGKVDTIMNTYDDVSASAALLRTILRTLVRAWPAPTEKRRLDGALLEALRVIWTKNSEIIDQDRMVDVLQANTAQRWFLYGTERGTGETAYFAIAKQMVKVYNHNKKSRKLEL